MTLTAVSSLRRLSTYSICKSLYVSGDVIDVLGVYRPPSSNESVFFDEIDQLLHVIMMLRNGKKSKIVMAGDFNLNLSVYSHHSSQFMDVIMSHVLTPTIFIPTRPSSNTLLDNIFISWPGLISSHVILCDISDHLPILIVSKLTDKVITDVKKSCKLKRIFNTNSINKFRALLRAENWESIYVDSNPCSAYQIFSNKLQSAFEISFPLKHITVKKRKGPRKAWMTYGLSVSAIRRSELYKLCLSGQITNDYYTSYRNRYTKLIKVAKYNFYNGFFKENKTNIKETWKLINQLSTKTDKSIVFICII